MAVATVMQCAAMSHLAPACGYVCAPAAPRPGRATQRYWHHPRPLVLGLALVLLAALDCTGARLRCTAPRQPASRTACCNVCLCRRCLLQRPPCCHLRRHQTPRFKSREMAGPFSRSPPRRLQLPSCTHSTVGHPRTTQGPSPSQPLACCASQRGLWRARVKPVRLWRGSTS